MSDARSEIEKLLSKMKKLLLVAGVPSYQIHMKAGCHKIDTCAKAFDWLHEILISKEYDRLNFIYNLLPEEVWIRYKDHGFDDHREVLLLEQAKKDLLKLWRKKRPRLFGKDKKVVFLNEAPYDSCRP